MHRPYHPDKLIKAPPCLRAEPMSPPLKIANACLRNSFPSLAPDSAAMTPHHGSDSLKMSRGLMGRIQTHDIRWRILERRMVKRFSGSTPWSFQSSIPGRAPDGSESFP
jgi:hypothetical protein